MTLLSELRAVRIPFVGGYKSRKKWEDAAWKIIAQYITPRSSSTLLQLLSLSERKNILYRVTAAHRLALHMPTMEISRELWLTKQTISAIRKSIAEEGYSSSHARGHKAKEFWKGPKKPKKKFYRMTKYGPMRDYTRME